MIRVSSGFVLISIAQFGISGDPQIASAWKEQKMPDDPCGKVILAGLSLTQ
jgi:hypothetical protein